MKPSCTLTCLSILFFLSAELVAQDMCRIITSKKGYVDGEYGVDSLKIIFSSPSLLSALRDEESGDPSPYYMYEEAMGYDSRSAYLFRNDTLYAYYPAVKKLSNPIMYLKGDEVYLGSYFNQSNGAKDYVFDHTLVGVLINNGAGLEATAGLSDESVVASCNTSCPIGLMAAYAYIFVASELMDED